LLLSHPGLSYTGPAQRTNRVSCWGGGGGGGGGGGVDAVCSAERQATYDAARCGGRQAVTGDDAIGQIGSLGNGAIEGPTTPIRHCHRRPTCLAHGWTCAAHVGDRAQKGPCAERVPAAWVCICPSGLRRMLAVRVTGSNRRDASPRSKVPKRGERRALVVLKLVRLDGCVTTMLLTRRLSSRCIRTRTPRTRS